MLVDTPNESWDYQLSFGVSMGIWLFSCEKHVTVKVALKAEATENRSSDSIVRPHHLPFNNVDNILVTS